MTSLVVLGDPFTERLARDGQLLHRDRLEVLQVNVGKLCNQACTHCHVDAGPHRREIMTRETADRILAWLATSEIHTVDITGGAPELNPNFEHLVTECRARGRDVIDRCNLTVFFEPGQEQLAEFLEANQVELACSLPCYLEENVDQQRGLGVFKKSIDALLLLNAIGYGRPDCGLVLDLVYNPIGVALPGPQRQLEEAYKHHLQTKYGIVFNRLWAIANMPISRFAHYLEHTDQATAYQQKLEDAHNPETVDQVMCRSTLSVDWQGRIYDCDFNQMLDWPLGNGQLLHLWDLEPDQLASLPIRSGGHCFGCTAGAGSSCSGALS